MNGSKIRIWEAIPFDRFSFIGIARNPGEILLTLPSGIVIQTGSTPIWVTNASVEGEEFIPNLLPFMEDLVGEIFCQEH